MVTKGSIFRSLKLFKLVHYGLSWVNWAILITKQYEYILLERVTERSVKVKVTCIEMMKKGPTRIWDEIRQKKF